MEKANDVRAGPSQYLTAVLELRPTRRKAAALERARAAAENTFWQIITAQRERADAVAGLADTKERHTAWRAATADIARTVLVTCAEAGIPESIGQGLVRDVSMAVGSYVELRAGGHEAEWPERFTPTAADSNAALERFVTASTREHETEARDALAKVTHQPGPRPLTIRRSRDAMLVRTGADKRIAVVLNVLRASDPAARIAKLLPGIEAASGEVIKGGASRTKIIVPVACSKWHEQKFLSGKAVLRSSLVRRCGTRWFLCAQFEFPVAATQRQTGAHLGVDRGIVNPVALAAVAADGAVAAAPPPAGEQIGKIIRRADERRRREQKRRAATSRRHVNAVDAQLHLLANSIVAEAKSRGAQVVIEKLDGLKQSITAARPKGARKGGWRRTLKRAQLGKLETLLTYKLRLAGLPKLRNVLPAGTSITCPGCAQRDPKSRIAQDRFECVACGFVAHADTVGAVNIARRGVAMHKITKGATLAPIEQDMVARLRLRGDSGLGPLAAGVRAASGFVAGRAAVDGAYDPQGLTSTAGQKVTQTGTKNASDGVFAERCVAFSASSKARKGRRFKGFSPARSGESADAG